MNRNHQRVTEALDELTVGLVSMVERELKAAYGEGWISAARDSFRDDRLGGNLPKGEVMRWDAAAALAVVWDQWNRVFKHVFGPLERSLVSELRDFRNRWAHQDQFTFDDAFRTLDSVERLLRAAGAAASATRVSQSKRDLLRQEFSQETQAAANRAHNRAKKTQDLVLYAICCVSVVFATFSSIGANAWLVAVFAVAVFGFLTWQRLTAPTVVFFGAHECPQCTKVIYGDACPYCAPRRPAPVEPRSATLTSAHINN